MPAVGAGAGYAPRRRLRRGPGRAAAGLRRPGLCRSALQPGLKYPGYRDRLPPAEYLTRFDAWLPAFVRALKPTGSLFVQISPRWAGHLQVKLEALGLALRDTIIWTYAFGPH